MSRNIVMMLFLLGTGICWAVGEYDGAVWAAENLKVVDGDSLENGEERIRILNIDAPEFLQKCYDANGWKYRCGFEAGQALRKLTAGGVVCHGKDKDRYGRVLAECYRPDGLNIGREMVLRGWAVAYGDAYLPEEEEARKHKRGIWQGRFMRPELFRALQKSRKSPRK